jgi:soluble lytic murein transglycosylase-like protein
VNRRHNPLLVLAVWLLIIGAARMLPARAPATKSPPAPVLGALEGPPIPAQWIEDLKQVADLAPPEYRPLVIETAKRYHLDPRLLASVAWVETGGTWDPHLQGAAGEIGLMQVMPETAAWIAQQRGEDVPDLNEPAVALDYGAWYLSRLMQAATTDALANYNAGPSWKERAPTVARQYSRRVLELREKVDAR